jgi:DNA-directed RNA polymerase specialized sigma24 family protein
LAVDAAVTRLQVDYPEAAAVVRLRFYAGLSVDETAKALGISPRTAARLWTYARAVLYLSLGGT